MGNVIPISGAKEAPRAVQSRMETLIINTKMVNDFRIPPFQRPLRINSKVQAVAEAIKSSETVEGVLTTSNSGQSAALMAQNLGEDSVRNLIAFLATAHSAWGRDPEYYRLWGNLNMTLCMWLWNRLVMDRDRSGNKRYVVLNVTEFKRCLMSASSDSDYVSWLLGRNLSDRDRGPCYARLKSIFVRRLLSERGQNQKILLMQPAWASR